MTKKTRENRLTEGRWIVLAPLLRFGWSALAVARVLGWPKHTVDHVIKEMGGLRRHAPARPTRPSEIYKGTFLAYVREGDQWDVQMREAIERLLELQRIKDVAGAVQNFCEEVLPSHGYGPELEPYMALCRALLGDDAVPPMPAPSVQDFSQAFFDEYCYAVREGRVNAPVSVDAAMHEIVRCAATGRVRQQVRAEIPGNLLRDLIHAALDTLLEVDRDAVRAYFGLSSMSFREVGRRHNIGDGRARFRAARAVRNALGKSERFVDDLRRLLMNFGELQVAHGQLDIEHAELRREHGKLVADHAALTAVAASGQIGAVLERLGAPLLDLHRNALETRFEVLEISVGTAQVLGRLGIECVGQYVQYTDAELLSLGFRRKHLGEIAEFLHDLGVMPGMAIGSFAVAQRFPKPR